MGGDETLNIIIKLKDEASKAIEGIKGNVESMKPTFTKMAAVGTAAFVGIAAVAYKSLDAYAEVERSQRQLEHAVIAVSKGTADQVVEINKLSDALQKKVGIDADSLNIGVAQLSTFGLQTKSVIQLTKSLADFTVNQDGVNASADQYIQNANTIAKALNGQFGILEKSGIRFTELQQKMILTGTETQKVAALQEGLAQNLRETTDTVGGIDVAMAKFHRTSEDISENLGKALLPALNSILETVQPLIQKFADWAEANPKLLAKIVLIAGAVTGLIAIIGFLGLALPPIIAGFGLLSTAAGFVATAFTAISWPILAIIAAIALLGFAVYEIIKHWDEIKVKTIEVWEAITTFLFGKWEMIKSVVAAGLGWVRDKFQAFTEPIAKAWNGLWDGLTTSVKMAWEGVKNVVKGSINWIIEKINVVIESINKVAQKGAKVIGFNAPQIPTIPLLAEGGIVNRPTLAMVGEAGPEAVIPLNKLGSFGGGNITITINNPEFKNQDDEARMRAMLDDVFRPLLINHKITA